MAVSAGGPANRPRPEQYRWHAVQLQDESETRRLPDTLARSPRPARSSTLPFASPRLSDLDRLDEEAQAVPAPGKAWESLMLRRTVIIDSRDTTGRLPTQRAGPPRDAVAEAYRVLAGDHTRYRTAARTKEDCRRECRPVLSEAMADVAPAPINAPSRPPSSGLDGSVPSIWLRPPVPSQKEKGASKRRRPEIR